MKRLLIVLLVCGCSAKSTSETLVDNVKDMIDVFEKNLPIECQTSKTSKELAVIKNSINSVAQACNAEKGVEQHKTNKWRCIAIFEALSLILLAYLFLKNKIGGLFGK